jgi:hypothetical protein
VANEKRSSHEDKNESTSDDQEGFLFEQVKAQQPVKSKKPRKYIEEALKMENAPKSEDFDKVMDIRAINLESGMHDQSFDSASMMLQSLKKLEAKVNESAEMDEAEFITDSRPTRKYDKEDLIPGDDRNSKHTKVFLKHEKRLSPSDPKEPKEKVNHSMMVIPPS